MPAKRLTDQLAYIVASVNRQLEDELQERLRPEGVPIDQLRVLEALDRGGALPMGELAEHALAPDFQGPIQLCGEHAYGHWDVEFLR